MLRTVVAEVAHTLRASSILRQHGEDADLDQEARVLVAALMDVAPGYVSRNAEAHADLALANRAQAAAERRANGEPLAYAVGSAAFRHLTLLVDPRVLIPRPETEIVVDEALKAMEGRRGGIAVDIGTGSGAIALALATEGAFDRIIATDVSPDALEVAQTNAARLAPPHAAIEFRLGADLAPLAGIRACLIVSNPPYIAPEEASSLPASVRDWEPALALFAGDGGMARYDQLLAGAANCLEQDGWLVLELDARRAGETAHRARSTGHFKNVRVVRDLAGRERVLVAQCI